MMVVLKKTYWINGIKIDIENLPFELPIDSPEKEFMFKLKYSVC